MAVKVSPLSQFELKKHTLSQSHNSVKCEQEEMFYVFLDLV